APQDTQPAARRAKPLKLVIGRHRERNAEGAGGNAVDGRTTLLAGALEIGFPTPYPGAELIVVAGLHTAYHAIQVLRVRCRGTARNDARHSGAFGGVVLRGAPAIADVAADVEPGPAIG